eukprot:6738306-Prymnesium_polylepis.1
MRPSPGPGPTGRLACCCCRPRRCAAPRPALQPASPAFLADLDAAPQRGPPPPPLLSRSPPAL